KANILRVHRPWCTLNLGAGYFVEQRIPEIRENMDVVTRLREYARRYTPLLGHFLYKVLDMGLLFFNE
ncbi:hypothetical protein, partial [Dehalobacter sp. UNSWDHB]|uniref:hypothetical protein n=1 Tax=Dehalobacter sp. UNSWDHB TaxID=1339256 RepID=UPI001A9892EE